MLSGIPGIYPLDESSTPRPYPVNQKYLQTAKCPLGGGGPLRTTALAVRPGFTEDNTFFSALEGRKDWSSYNNGINRSGHRGLAEVEWFSALIRSWN